ITGQGCTALLGEWMRLRAAGSRIHERQGGQPWPGRQSIGSEARLTSDGRACPERYVAMKPWIPAFAGMTAGGFDLPSPL
ncbi:hypothetical protein AB4084_32470, partial [Lysobacter sp. 2RAB21]